ncbi:MAG: hypothetical protein ACI8UO_001822 [Verrucomicrobiales bacterium]
MLPANNVQLVRVALEEIDLSGMEKTLPEAATKVIDEANSRIDDFFETERNRKYPRYLPSDPGPFFLALDFLTREDIPLGKVFCEWGSGFGVHACLAALLEYESYGLEIETELVELASTLAEDLGLKAEFLKTSYVPEGFESYTGLGGEELVLPDEFTTSNRGDDFEPSYEGMPHLASEIDVIFVYPHPNDQEFMHQLFDAIACEGAILVAYYAHGDIHAFRKVFEDDEEED